MSKVQLTNEQYAKLLDAERTIHDILPDLQKLEECDVDCQQFRAQVEQRQRQIAALKQNFAPGVK